MKKKNLVGLFGRYKNKPVLVIRMLFHVQSSESFGLVDEGSLFTLRQGFPFGTQPFGDLRVVHFRVLLSHFPTLTSTPDHEGIHGSLHSVGVVFVVGPVHLLHALDVVIMRRGGAGHFTARTRAESGRVFGQLGLPMPTHNALVVDPGGVRGRW